MLGAQGSVQNPTVAASAAQTTLIFIGSDMPTQWSPLRTLWWVENVFDECLPTDTRFREQDLVR
ncbi:MAG: hypothetical protein ACI9TF_001828 [Paracrocinitomix sp.]|jgi:hypothetical protein